MTMLYYDDEYCCGLIKAALGKVDKSEGIRTSKIKRLILERVVKLKDVYGLTHEDIYSEVVFDFLSKSRIVKIDDDKGSPTTFILQYTFNMLRNLERKCKRGTFYGASKYDAMKLIDEGIYELFSENDSILRMKLEGIDYDDPETILIKRQTIEQMKAIFTIIDLQRISKGDIDEALQAKLNEFNAT